MMIISLAIIFLVIILFFSKSSFKRKQSLKKKAQKKIIKCFEEGTITKRHYDLLQNKLMSELWLESDIEKHINEFKTLKIHEEYLIKKYGLEVGSRLVLHEYWTGMTEEQLLDCKGNPDKIIKEVLKTKTKYKFIYGNNNSGDVFILENNEVTKFTDR